MVAKLLERTESTKQGEGKRVEEKKSGSAEYGSAQATEEEAMLTA